MREQILVLALAAAVLAAPAPAKEPEQPQYKTAEAKHYTRAEGVELSPEFSDYLYAELRAELQKTKVFAQVIGEGEVVPEADAPSSVLVEGNISEYKKGSVVKEQLIGFGAGRRSLNVETTVKRRSDQKELAALKTKVKTSPRWDEKVLARNAAKQIANEIKKALKQGPPAGT